MIDFNVTRIDDDLPPCPWCRHDGVRYQPSATKPDTRFFECSTCRRQFAIGWILESADRIVPTAS